MPEVPDFFTNRFFGILAPIARKERGRFRALLSTALSNFAADVHRWPNRKKSALQEGLISLDEAEAARRFQSDFIGFESPDQAFRRACTLELIREAMNSLRREYRTRDKEALYQSLEPLLDSPDSERGYAEIASEFSMSEDAFKMAVSRFRMRFKHLLEMGVARSIGWEGEEYSVLKREKSSDPEFAKALVEEQQAILQDLA